MSIVVVATILPKAEHRDEVVAALEAVIPRVHAEDAGCELYAMHEGPDRIVMIEKWSDADALAAHGQSDALAELGGRLTGLLAAPSDVQMLHARPAGRPEFGQL